jgi:glycosyltransferase involved in cell wall biosynthesis
LESECIKFTILKPIPYNTETVNIVSNRLRFPQRRLPKTVLRGARMISSVVDILIIFNGWSTKTIAGGEYHMLTVAARWKEESIALLIPKIGYEIATSVFSSADSFYFSSSEERDIIGLTSLSFLYLQRIFRSLFFRFKKNPDVVIASSHYVWDTLPGLIFHRRLKSKLVVYMHGLLETYESYTESGGFWNKIALLNERVSLMICRKADLIFAINNDIKEALIEKGFKAEKIIVTTNAVDYEQINSVKNEMKTFDGCFCGSLIIRKGVYELIELWEKVLKRLPTAKLIIIGHGQEYPNLVEEVKNKDLDKNITFTGYLSGSDKFASIKSAKIFISTSHVESWGIAVSEATACGLPVVCYDIPSFRNSGRNLVKVKLGDTDKMATVILNMLKDEQTLDYLTTKSTSEATNLPTWDGISIEELKEIKKVIYS